MVEIGKKTLTFPNRREVFVEPNAHGATYEYRGQQSHVWCNTQEGLGNKNWIAEWMYQNVAYGGNTTPIALKNILISDNLLRVIRITRYDNTANLPVKP